MTSNPNSLLLLAGTSEAADLARLLAAAAPELRVVVRFAGRTDHPADLPGEVQVGGFGGVEGLVDHLRAASHDRLVDATHPFAETMSTHATEAAARAGIPALRLLRPPWSEHPGDRWHRVPDLPAAAAALDALGIRRPLLAIGRQQVATFTTTVCDALVLRSVDPPPPPLDPRLVVVTDRGPFAEDAELAVLDEHRIDGIVARDSGGQAAVAKLAAARARGLPVVLVDRPPPPAGPVVETVAEALAWILGDQAAAGGGVA